MNGEKLDPDYIGDGVYVHHDGYHVWLTTQEGMRIALEPRVFDALIGYRQRLLQREVES